MRVNGTLFDTLQNSDENPGSLIPELACLTRCSIVSEFKILVHGRRTATAGLYDSFNAN